MRRLRGRTRAMGRALLLLAMVVALVPGTVPSQAATPGSGTMTGKSGPITYAGKSITSAPPALSRFLCSEGQNCDTFVLTLNLPTTFYDTKNRVLTVSISWPSDANDLDLFLCKGTASSDPQCVNGLVVSSAQGGTNEETVTVTNPAAGTYRIITAAYDGTSAYTGNVTFAAPATQPGPKPVLSKSNGFKWRATAVANNSNYGEPSVDVDHAGNIYVTAPGGAGVQMWRSFDGGFTFDHVEIGSDGGGGDSEIEFSLSDIGYTADLRITDSAISRSTDRFDSWTQQGVGIEQDRQWLAHLCDREVYLGYHDFVVEAEMFNRSADGGITWDQAPTFISPHGDAPGSQDPGIYVDQGGNTFSGPLVVDQKTGDMYIVFAVSTAEGNATTGTPPYGEPEQIVVGSSNDNGHTWALHLVQSGGPGTLAGVIFPWITLDRAGNVYVSYAGRSVEDGPINVFLSYSKDHGATWSTPYRVNADATGHAHVYTTISAGDPGVVDVAWYTGTTTDPSDPTNDWYVDFAQVRSASTAKPVITTSRAYPYPIHHGEICLQGLLCVLGGDRSLLDFFQVQVGPDGNAKIAFANNATPDGKQRIWYVGQLGGPKAGSALHDTAYCQK